MTTQKPSKFQSTGKELTKKADAQSDTLSTPDEDSSGYEDALISLNRQFSSAERALSRLLRRKGYFTVLVAFAATLLVFMNNKHREDGELNDYKTLTNVFGGYSNKAQLRDMSALQDDFFGHLDNLHNLDNLIFQELDKSSMKITLEIFHKQIDNYNTGGPLESFDISNIKDANLKFNRDSFSKDYVLPFDWNDSAELKQNSYDFNSVAIRATDFKFITYADVKTYRCRNWNFIRMYHFVGGNLVSYTNSADYQRCNWFRQDSDSEQGLFVEEAVRSAAPNTILGDVSDDLYMAMKTGDDTFSYMYDRVDSVLLTTNLFSLLVNIAMAIMFFKIVRIKLLLKSLRDEKMDVANWIIRHSKVTDMAQGQDNTLPLSPHRQRQNQVQKILEEYDQPNPSLEIFGFFGISFILCIFCMLVANVIWMISETQVMHLPVRARDLATVLMSWGVLFAWLSILEVISIHPGLAIINETFKNSMPSLGWFVLSVMPIFCGYLFAGYVVFNDGDRFGDLTSAFINLIALIAGDEVQLNLQLYNKEPFWGPIYGFSFCLLFLVIIHNTIILLISNGYDRALETHKQTEKKEKKKQQISQERVDRQFAKFGEIEKKIAPREKNTASGI